MSIIQKTTLDDLVTFIRCYDRHLAAGAGHAAALKAAADELSMNPKTAKERWDALHTTLEVWDAFEEGKLSYSKLKCLSTERTTPAVVNRVLDETLSNNLAPKDINALKKKLAAG